jgi:hypothetical protein
MFFSVYENDFFFRSHRAFENRAPVAAAARSSKKQEPSQKSREHPHARAAAATLQSDARIPRKGSGGGGSRGRHARQDKGQGERSCLSFPAEPDSKGDSSSQQPAQGERVGALLCRLYGAMHPAPRRRRRRARRSRWWAGRGRALKPAPPPRQRWISRPALMRELKDQSFQPVRYRALLLLLKRERKTSPRNRKEQKKGEEISRGPRSERLSSSADTGQRTWAIFLSG